MGERFEHKWLMQLSLFPKKKNEETGGMESTFETVDEWVPPVRVVRVAVGVGVWVRVGVGGGEWVPPVRTLQHHRLPSLAMLLTVAILLTVATLLTAQPPEDAFTDEDEEEEPRAPVKKAAVVIEEVPRQPEP